jgi:hypothetical protein
MEAKKDFWINSSLLASSDKDLSNKKTQSFLSYLCPELFDCKVMIHKKQLIL